jgi:hypothetical protein
MLLYSEFIILFYFFPLFVFCSVVIYVVVVYFLFVHLLKYCTHCHTTVQSTSVPVATLGRKTGYLFFRKTKGFIGIKELLNSVFNKKSFRRKRRGKKDHWSSFKQPQNESEHSHRRCRDYGQYSRRL